MHVAHHDAGELMLEAPLLAGPLRVRQHNQGLAEPRLPDAQAAA